MQFQHQHTDGCLEIRIEGAVTVSTIAQLHKETLAVIEDCTAGKIDFRGVDDLDVAGVQWLLSAWNYAQRRQLELTICHWMPVHQHASQRIGVLMPDEFIQHGETDHE